MIMKNELKRALLKKTNIILILVVFSLMFINAYFDGWKTALTAESAQDILNAEDAIYYKKYFGNIYRVWKSSYYMVQALAPLILVAPYLNSFLSEKANRFRFFCVSRKGNFKYVMQKTLAIALSGTIILASAEGLFAFFSGLLTQKDTSVEFMQQIVSFQESYFMSNPMSYFALIYISHIIYYFCFTIFAVGITSFLKNRIAVIAAPFIVVGVLDMALPITLQPNVVMQPYSQTFSLNGYGILISMYVITGLILLTLSESSYQKRGN